jgi:hypothetical protein
MFVKSTGSIFSDERGSVSFDNGLDLSEVKRMYLIENKDISIQRAWQAHKVEKRWFVAVKGKFLVKIVKVDDFNNPSDNLKVSSFELDSNKMDSLLIDAGYATSIQSLETDSKLLVFSNYKMGDVDDNIKFPQTKWQSNE